MRAFMGEFTPKLDDKGRFFLPAKFREGFADGLVITKAQDRCLAIYPTEVYLELIAKVAEAPATVKQVRAYQRMLSAGASDDVPDRQGRVSVPQVLRDYAELKTDIVVIGATNRLEIWDADRWREYSAEQDEIFADMDEDLLGKLGGLSEGQRA